MNFAKVSTLFVSAFCAEFGLAYEPVVHQALSEQSTLASVVAEIDTMSRRGFAGPISGSRAKKYSNSKGVDGTILTLIRDGAAFEDDVPRSINHFFNPRTNSALNLNGEDYIAAGDLPDLKTLIRIAAAAVNLEAITSPDWALGDRDGTVLTNGYTFKSARLFYRKSVTAPDTADRRGFTGELFETLGRLIHHIQDMAQPQHVRNDPHLQTDSLDPHCPASMLTPFYGAWCPVYLRYKAESIYEAWTTTLSNTRGYVLPTAGYPKVYGTGSDGLATFLKPRDFWTLSGKGLADFTNRNFLSTGTMNLAPPTTGTAFVMKVADACNGLVPPCEAPYAPDDYITFYQSTVDDQFRPGTGGPHPYAAAQSIFTPDLKQYSPGHRLEYTVNRFTFAYDHAYLLPRAVGYSAGLLNYFFRGDMDIAIPPDGVFAIVDTTLTGCGSPCGFRKIKLLIKNTTPNDDMGAGTLQVVAKYHRNDCYSADLSGDDGAPDFRGIDCRSPDEYVSVSDPMTVASVSRTYPNQALVFTFLATPIPIDDSDLSLQVVFRGVLGQEADAVAVTTKDIAEPNHYAVANVSDYVFDDVGDMKYHSLPYLGITNDVAATNFGIAFGANQTPLATVPVLRGGQFARFAYLTDKFVTDVPVTFFYWGSPHPHINQPHAFELDDVTGQYRRSCQVWPTRGLYWENFFFFNQYRSASIHRSVAQGAARAEEDELVGQLMSEAQNQPGTKQLKVGFDCATPTGGVFDMTLMAPFTAPTAIPWTINF